METYVIQKYNDSNCVKDSAQRAARRAARCALRFQISGRSKTVFKLSQDASTRPLKFRGRMGRRTSTVHRERTEKKVFRANFLP